MHNTTRGAYPWHKEGQQPRVIYFDANYKRRKLIRNILKLTFGLSASVMIAMVYAVKWGYLIY